MPPPDATTETPPRRKHPMLRRNILFLAIWIFLIFQFAPWFRGPRLVTLRNTTDQTIYYNFVEYEKEPRAEFKGILEPGDVAHLRADALDKVTLWSDSAGRYVLNCDGKSNTYRVELGRNNEIVLREFKPGEIMP
jgi:hypothetical protein